MYALRNWFTQLYFQRITDKFLCNNDIHFIETVQCDTIWLNVMGNLFKVPESSTFLTYDKYERCI